MKIGLLQCNLICNDVTHNKKTILEAVRKAHAAGAELCVTSELALCGCPGTDLLLRKAFADYCLAVLEEIAETLVKEKLPPLLVGAPISNPVPQGKPLHNCGVFLRDGRVMVISRKVLLATDGTHDDQVYFEPGVACGVLQFNGWRFCVTVGEDVWNDRGFWKGRRDFDADPVEEFMGGGADAIINLTAVPYFMGQPKLHRQVLSWMASKYRVPVIAVNQVGGMDSAVYPGGSMLVNAAGALCMEAALFEEDVRVVELEKDIKLSTTRQEEREAENWQALVTGARDFVRKSGFSRVVLGLSGGIDSALVAAVAAEAVGPENVLGVLMPSPYSSKGSVDDSRALAANLGIQTTLVPIEKAMSAYAEMLAEPFKGKGQDTTEENIQSRIRCNILMAFSNKLGCMLLNTGNKSEAAVGYSTLYGDSGGALCVIGDLYKYQVYRLSEWLNQKHGRALIPQAIIDKEPSAELRPGQKDSDSLPPYEVLDEILSAYIDGGRDINGLLSLGFAPETVRRVLNMYRKAEFKRRQSPPALHLTRHAFGQFGYMPVATTVSM